jgi:hypothetical protein
MQDGIIKPVSRSSGANIEAGREVNLEGWREVSLMAEKRSSDPIPKKPIAIVTYLWTASDMAGFAVELPFRWKSLGLKKELPLPTKLGYGLMLNAVTDMWLLTSGVGRKSMDLNSVTVVKNYIGFMNTMDDYLDDPEKRHAVMRFCKGDELWGRRKDIFLSIGQYDESLQKKLKRVISASAFAMLDAVVRSRKRGVSSLDDALYLREKTAGEICRATAEIFNLVHGVPPAKARAIEEAYWNVGMVLQVHDDVGDVCKDEKEGHPENLVLQMLNERPDEKARLMEALAGKKNCSYGRMVKHAPETARAARDLQDRYLAAIPEAGGFERIRCLIDLTVSLRGHSVALRSIIDRMDL